MTVVPYASGAVVLLAFTISEPAFNVKPPVKELFGLESKREPLPFFTTYSWKPSVPSTASDSIPLNIELSEAALLITS